MNLKELEQKREDIVTSFFWLALYIAVIFGVPAVLAALVGNKINSVYNTKGFEFILLFFAFVLSWAIIAREYKKKTRILNDLDSQIKEARFRENK